MKTRLICAIATLGLVIGSAATFKAITGECPLGWTCRHLRGAPAGK
jgi:hypothetical protein